MRKRGRPVVLLALLAMIAGACTGGGSSEGGGGDGGGGDGGGGEVTLNLWVFEGEDTFLPTLKQAFEAEHANITVDITNIPEDNYVTKVDTALAAGSPPDIGYMYEPRWMKAGQVLPLDDVIASQGIEVSKYNQSAFSYCVLDGKTYCLGSYAGAIMVFYNRDLFDAAGLPYPSATEPMTVDAYAALAHQLTQPTDDLSKYVWGGYADVTTWWTDPRTVFSEDGRKTEGYVNDAATAHAYGVLSSMILDGDAPSSSDSQFFGNTDPLATGQLAMTIVDNVVAIPELEHAKIPWGAAPTPVEQAGDAPWVGSWTDYWGVFADSDHAQAAKEFVAFVGTEGNRLRAEAGQMPLDSTVADEVGWAGDSPGRAEALDVIKLARPGILLPANIFSIDPPLWDAFSLMVEDGKPAQEGLDEAAPDMQQNLDRAWTTWEQI